MIVGNVVVCKKLTLVNREHDTNAFSPIVMTEFGIVTEITPEPLNALAPILVTLYVTPPLVIVLGIVIAPVAFGFETTVASVTIVV